MDKYQKVFLGENTWQIFTGTYESERLCVEALKVQGKNALLNWNCFIVNLRSKVLRSVTNTISRTWNMKTSGSCLYSKIFW